MKLLLVAALLDVSPKPSDPFIAVEALGKAFAHQKDGEDRGLSVGTWTNTTLNRDETWHQEPGGEWFIRARDGIYVLAVSDADGWRAVPSERLVWRGGEWKKVKRRKQEVGRKDRR